MRLLRLKDFLTILPFRSFSGPPKFRKMGQKGPFCWIFYILKFAGLEPKIFVVKSSYKEAQLQSI